MATKSGGSVRSGEVGAGPSNAYLAQQAAREAIREGGGSRLATDTATGTPVAGTAAQGMFNAQIRNAGFTPTQVALAGGLDPLLVNRFGSNYYGRALEGGRGTPGGGRGSPVGSGAIGGVRPAIGISNAGALTAMAIPGLPGMLAGLFGLANRAFGPFPGVTGPIAPRPQTQSFRDTVGMGRSVRGAFGAGGISGASGRAM